MLLVHFAPQSGEALGYAGGPFDEAANLLELLIKKGEDMDGAKLPLVEILIHEVRVLVSQEHAQMELATFGGNTAKDRQIGDHVATPVFRDDEYVQGARQVLEDSDVRRVQLKLALVFDEAVLVARHLGLEFVVGHALLKAFTGDCHTCPLE